MGKYQSKKIIKHANKASHTIKVGKYRNEAGKKDFERKTSDKPSHVSHVKTLKASEAFDEELLKLAERNHMSSREIKGKARNVPTISLAPPTLILPTPSHQPTHIIKPFEAIDTLLERDRKIKPVPQKIANVDSANRFRPLDDVEDEEDSVQMKTPFQIQPATFTFQS